MEKSEYSEDMEQSILNIEQSDNYEEDEFDEEIRRSSSTGETVPYLISSYTQQVHLNKSAPRKAIIVIPGICGSELFSASAQVINGNQYSDGYTIWPPQGINNIIEGGYGCGLCNTVNTDTARLIADMSLIACNEDGTSKSNVMVSNPIIDCRENRNKRNFGSVNCYCKLMKSLINNPDLADYQIVFFSYDWRLSNAVTAQELQNFINKQNFSEVVLIGHSMGGLICSSYVASAENRERVDKVILLGAPLLGAAKSFAAMEKGTFFDGLVGFVSSPIAHPFTKDLARKCQSVYELLPSRQSIVSLKDSYLYQENGACGLSTDNRYDPMDYQESVGLINSRNWNQHSREFIERAQQFHDSLNDSDGRLVIANSELVDTYNIVGFNSDTLKSLYIKFKNNGKKLKTRSAQCNGDGTVSIDSSTAKNGFSREKVYYAKNVSHMGLMSDKNCLDLINNIITGQKDVFNPTVIQKYMPSKSIMKSGCLPPILSCLETD